MSRRKAQLNFSVVYATSQSDQTPASNLVNASPYSAGWTSLPNAPMPQEIVVDFGSTVVITQLQFVSHQNKIASEIIISTARDSSNWRVANFQDIGEFQFSDNRQNDYKAREIRTANVPNVKARFLKLTFTKVHANKLNKKNQVGLVALSAFGLLEDNASNDPEIAKLEREKREAVDSENFALAQRIKDRITILKENRAKLMELARMKDEAVRNEDFALAQRLKSQIDRIQFGEPADIPEPMPPQPQFSQYQRMSTMIEDQPPPRSAAPRQSLMSEQMYDPDPLPPAPEPQMNPPPPRVEFDDDRPLNPAPGGTYNWEDELDQPNDDLFGGREQEPVHHRRRRSTRDGRRQQRDPDQNLLEFEDDQQGDNPDEIDPKYMQEADPFVQQFGERTVQYFYSKSVTNRVRGINEIADAIAATKSNQHPQLFSRFCHILRARLAEEAIGVFVAATQAMMRLSDELRLSGDNIRNAIEPHLPAIIKRLGDKKEQISKAARAFVMWTAENEALGIPSLAPCLMGAQGKSGIVQNAAERLKIIQELLDRYGTVDQSFDTGTIINFVFLALQSKMSEVRTNACKVCKVLAGMGAGPQISKMLQSSNLSAQTQNMVRSVISGQ